MELSASLSDQNDAKNNVEIKLVGLPRILASWTYTAENDNCDLCHNELTEPVKDDRYMKNIYNNGAAIGVCGHGFHILCIDTWTKSGNLSCPNCRTLWKIKKNANPCIHVYRNSV